MATVMQILHSKQNNNVYTVAPDTTVLDAAKLMAEKHIGGLLVMEKERIVGIVTERDYARKIALTGLPCGEKQVRDIMSSPVMYVRPDQTGDECMALITENRLRHLPVVDEGKLIGLISIGDLVKDVISSQKFTIKQLEHYIMGDLG
jgi:CBS domain-containing protein